MGSLFLMFGLLAAGSWLVVAPAAAQPVEQFYKGKTMTIMLGHPPGGSYDLEGARSCVHPSRRMGAATDLGFTEIGMFSCANRL